MVANAARKKTSEVVSMVTALQMVSAGLGVTVVPSLSLSSLRMTGLVARPIGPPTPPRTVGILMLADRPPAAAGAAFLDLLRTVSARQ
ncbi:LysR substrate-binding domain-containing protein [Caballeronia sp. 15711]|uniref:LysR substrate-binding domain-containing protein n=1 Tax=Caballeronia sp. 15711 TaxID=3391029 RepID=UPI0039E3939C